MTTPRSLSPDCILPAEATASWAEAVAPREPQSPLRITFTHPPARLRVCGIIDESTHGLLTRALSRAAEVPEHDLLIDMSEVEFCDLGGWRAIMSAATRPAAPRVTLTSVPAQTRTIIGILGWDGAPGVRVM